MRLHEVTIVAGADYLGQVRHTKAFSEQTWDANDDRARLRFERRVQVSLAGARAEKRAFPGSRYSARASGDYRVVAEIAWHLFPTLEAHGPAYRAQQAWLTVMQYETDCLLEWQWDFVEALAAALLERRRLTGTQAMQVIYDATSHRP